MASDDRENVWENFLRRYYKDEIEDLVAFGRSSLEVDYQDLVTFNRKLADSLVGSPKSVLSDAEDTLLDFNVQNEADLPEDATLIFSNLPKTKLSELSSSSIGKLVRTYGVVSEISDEYLIVSRGVFRCQSCATRHVVDMDISREEYQEPSRCKGCQKQGNFKIVEDECDFVSVRDVTLSPPLEEEEFKNSQNYSCVFFGEEAREVSLGDYVSVNVIPTTNGNDGSDLSFYLRTRKVVPEEPSYSYMFDNLDDDEKEAIRKLADEDIYQKFVDSIAPTVPVDDTIKLAMLLQLFGGVEKEVEYTEYGSVQISIFQAKLNDLSQSSAV
ncbi:hypothetical protein EGH25_10505 [Haladaptatus sp. F3-133]|uniref:DNA helicase n=1 Tax=Halorutilus salinus TaxID=2487751 RepID=A0A9Q4C6D6_9EURY|nr:hypothetical protein [Halorutilus salinus]MCX2819779.1 hypothetical protein [Halorutilus salinus]